MATAVALQHVAAGCNRCTHALHWGDSGLLAYAAHNAVLVYEPQEARVLSTLLGHTDRVNCVHWLPAAAFFGPGAAAAAAPLVLASGAGDGTVRVWLWTPHTPAQPWRLAATLQGHSAPVTSLTAFPLGSDGGSLGMLLASTAGDGEVHIWECTPCSSYNGSGGSGSDGSGALPDLCSWQLQQRIPVGHQLQDCTAVAALPGGPGWLLLAAGGVDGAVRLYARSPGGQFQLACKLTGHQDWVRGLAFGQPDDGKLLLASASQDKNIRVWAISQQEQQAAGQAASQPGASANGTATGAPLAASLTRYAPRPLIRAGQHTYAATLEAVLIGHEDWVHSVAWHPSGPQPDGSGSSSQSPCLLSASMDRTMMLWRPDQATGLWMSEESVGDAGANHLGYYTGVWAPDGHGIATHGFTGALHIWRRAGADAGWVPQHALGGHWGPVVDACWAADGGCLLTVSTDQTARITTRLQGGHWCEIARTQVHGHDFSSAAALPPRDAGPGRPPSYVYASASEEKVLRVFEAPRAFHDTLAAARGRAAFPTAAAAGSGSSNGAAVLGALLPALGLSNKAVYEDEAAIDEGGSGVVPTSSLEGRFLPGTGAAAYEDGPDLAPNAAPGAVVGPPLEEHLAQNTLWPEIHKLYGHGNDAFCLAADPLGGYLASACRAQSADTAAIWLWDTSNWTGVAQLPAHTLTVTQLAFSPDGRFLASASRDRTVALFERQQQPSSADGPAAAGATGAAPFRLVGRIKAHARIVWGLHWSPDGRLLATASRDGKVKVWAISPAVDGSLQLPASAAATIDCGDSVRSVQFAPDCQPGASYHLAAGLENGSVQLVRLGTQEAAPATGGQQQLASAAHELLWQSRLHEQHAAAVRRLCWRRDEEEGQAAQGQPEQQRYLLASCSDDHSLRVFSVCL